MLPTIADVLALPELAAGRPRVMAGAEALDRPVRWVHVAPAVGTRRLLLGGELLLTTGVGLDPDERELEAYVDELVAAGAAGLVLELGDRFQTAPPALVNRCQRVGFALIVLHREVRFVSITEAVHARIIDSQSEALRARDRVHEVFAELSRRPSSTGFVLEQVARMLRSPVVLEDLNHRALAWSSFDRDPGTYLRDWTSRSRLASQQSAARPAPYERTSHWAGGGWLRTPVEARGRTWGTLVAVGCDDVPLTGEAAMENAAIALALARLDGDDEWTLSGHRALLDGLVAGAYVGLDDLRSAFEATGFRTADRVLTAAAIRTDRPIPAVLATLRDVCPRRNVDVVGVAWIQAPDDTALVLFSAARQADSDGLVESLLAQAAGGGDVRTTVAVGPETPEFEGLRASADAAIGLLQSLPRRVPVGTHMHRPRQAALAMLMHRSRSDPALQEFVESVLGPLLAYDAEHGTDLVVVARAYVEHPTNRKAAAAACHLSRSVFYQRIERIESVLGIDLRDGDAVGALQVALVAHRQR